MTEALTPESKPHLIECKGCRKKAKYFTSVRGMRYGECCKDKVPTKKSFDEYVNENANEYKEELQQDKGKRRGNYRVPVV